MLTAKLALYLVAGATMSSCMTGPRSSINRGSDAQPSPTQPETVRMETKELRYLVQMSELIVTGIVRSSNPLVDPEKMEEELGEGGTPNLPKSQRYLKGFVYDIEITNVIYSKTPTRSEVVSIFSLGNPLALHSKLGDLPTERNILFSYLT